MGKFQTFPSKDGVRGGGGYVVAKQRVFEKEMKAQVCNFALLLLHYLKFDGSILDSLECQKFWTHNTKLIA